MRSDLLCIITRWEQSGQGEGGGRDPQEEEEAVNFGNDDDDESCTTSQADDEDSRVRDNIGGLSGRDQLEQQHYRVKPCFSTDALHTYCISAR